MASRNVCILASSVYVSSNSCQQAASWVCVFADTVISDFYATVTPGQFAVSLFQQNCCCNYASIILKAYAKHKILRPLMRKFSVKQGKREEFSLEQAITADISAVAKPEYCQIRQWNKLDTRLKQFPTYNTLYVSK